MISHEPGTASLAMKKNISKSIFSHCSYDFLGFRIPSCSIKLYTSAKLQTIIVSLHQRKDGCVLRRSGRTRARSFIAPLQHMEGRKQAACQGSKSQLNEEQLESYCDMSEVKNSPTKQHKQRLTHTHTLSMCLTHTHALSRLSPVAAPDGSSCPDMISRQTAVSPGLLVCLRPTRPPMRGDSGGWKTRSACAARFIGPPQFKASAPSVFFPLSPASTPHPPRRPPRFSAAAEMGRRCLISAD